MIAAVTGATGFVGTNLIAELLSQGHKVRALLHAGSRAEQGLRKAASTGERHRNSSRGRAFPGTLSSARFQVPRVVFHLAAQISDQPPRCRRRAADQC